MEGIRVSPAQEHQTTYVIQPPAAGHSQMNQPNRESASNYIIETNQKLDNEIKILRMEKFGLEKEKESIEEEQDKLEEKNRYLKGLLKNFAEMDKMYKKVSSKRQEMLTIAKDNHSLQMKNMKKLMTSPRQISGEMFLAALATIIMQNLFLFATGTNYNPYISSIVIMFTQTMLSHYVITNEVNNILEFSSIDIFV